MRRESLRMRRGLSLWLAATLPACTAPSAPVSAPPPPRIHCSSHMHGDGEYEACMPWCRESLDDKEITNHCAFCKCRSCTFWTQASRQACEGQMAARLNEKWKARNSSHSTSKKPSLPKDGPRDLRAVKRLNDWLGIKPKVPEAWQRLEAMLSSGLNLMTKSKKQSNATQHVHKTHA